MKKIIPFNNIVDFKTDVKEITAISLEHEIKKYPDMISGVFYISGEYKITEGLLEKEKFNFELPFDIALTNNYEIDSLLVDIDDFRYDLISDKKLKVNIDLYIDGEEIEEPSPRNTYTEELIIKNDETISINDKSNINIEEIITETEEERKIEEKNIDEDITLNKNDKNNIEIKDIYEDNNVPPKEIINEKISESNIKTDIDNLFEELNFENEINKNIEPERIDLLKDMLTNNKENEMNENPNLNINTNITNNDTDKVTTNIFSKTQEEEKYVTYRVYKVLENDTIDTILTKYNITKEMLSDYNNIENITTGDKLIIPTINNDEK